MLRGDKNNVCKISLAFVGVLLSLLEAAAATAPLPGSPSDLKRLIREFASYSDRSTGSVGCQAAALKIKNRFKRLGLLDVGVQRFTVPVRRHGVSRLIVTASQKSCPLTPFRANALSPGGIPKDGISGPLYYVKTGELRHFNGMTVKDAIVLMDLHSGKNWQNAAMLGARALIYLDRGTKEAPTPAPFFTDKFELTPIVFPRFYLAIENATILSTNPASMAKGLIAKTVTLSSRIEWQKVEAQNIYALIPGTGPRLSREIIMLESFYDSTALVYDRSPGADEACGIAALITLAEILQKNPQPRSILLVATAGHAQSLAGMREVFHALMEKSADLEALQHKLTLYYDNAQVHLKTLDTAIKDRAMDEPGLGIRLKEALIDRLKTETDRISRQLIKLRMDTTATHAEQIDALTHERRILRRLGWREDFGTLSEEEGRLIAGVIKIAAKDHRASRDDAHDQITRLATTLLFRRLFKDRKLAATVSLHLSSKGSGVGAFNQGWLYNLKSNNNRISVYRALYDLLAPITLERDGESGEDSDFINCLRPGKTFTWDTYFIDHPPLGGEVSALAGYLGITLATVHDARFRWGTPFDLPQYVDMASLFLQIERVRKVVARMAAAPILMDRKPPRSGFASITGNARFLRHGELFADQRAPDTVILAYQGNGLYHAMTDALGTFYIHGVADRNQVLEKVIIEGLRFDPETGSAVWAIDKKLTGKSAYRLKIRRRHVETDLTMFACNQTTLFNLVEPLSLQYITKIQLFDGRIDTLPERYWYSRIDTRRSTLASIFVEPGTPLKLTLSNTILSKRLILTHADSDHPWGKGYLPVQWPFIYTTDYLAARDMWRLLGPRIANLEQHGIFDENIADLFKEGTHALDRARRALENQQYDTFKGAAEQSSALAGRVYNQVEDTQKDILVGVLFYIALFIPFAFCLERLLFAFIHIHKRIIAFFGLLLVLILVIYKVHPAFQIAYSPLVIILAFFIMGLSTIVTWIIFFRFEDEMLLIQRRVRRTGTEISRFKAFTAAFMLGVGNLRRRRTRTALTCITLGLLTFTIMSFTSVKSSRKENRIIFGKDPHYQGILFKHPNWQSFPPEALQMITNAFTGNQGVAPRAFLETADRIHSLQAEVSNGGVRATARAVIGLSPHEPGVSGMDTTLTRGRWFTPFEYQAVLLPDTLAAELGIEGPLTPETQVKIWGTPFRVVGVFKAARWMQRTDLDDEPLTPVTFPGEIVMKMTEVEMEALESGEDVRNFQSRYKHVDAAATLILPYGTLMAAGGQLKNIAVKPAPGFNLEALTRKLTQRFSLTFFSSDKDAVYVNYASERLQYSGVPAIAVPIVIAILIVLNTMIGSVFERKAEIGVYTSVGLAPSHISFLFVAEAIAFAVLSVVLGYLVAQTSAHFLSKTALWAGITVNYSSLSGVSAMMLVIVVVLISVIYPSKVASQIAIPDVERSFRLPPVMGETLTITLPFLLKIKELYGAGGYLFDYFGQHRDVSHGIFSAGPITASCPCPLYKAKSGVTLSDGACDANACQSKACFRIKLNVWPAPFDLGIMQTVDLFFARSKDEPEYLEIKIDFTRRSGEIGAWKRTLKVFVNTLRKQLLIYRSLDERTREDFASQFPVTTDPTP